LGLDPQGDRAVMDAQMAGNPAQVHPVHVHLDRFPTQLFRIGPRLGLGSVLDLAEHAAITLTAAVCFPSSMLAFRSVTFWTFDHFCIIAQFLATPLKIMGALKVCGFQPWGRRVWVCENRLLRFSHTQTIFLKKPCPYSWIGLNLKRIWIKIEGENTSGL